jgi:hypothetical protein
MGRGATDTRITKKRQMKIQVSTHASGIQSAEVLKENSKTWIVRLPDGNVVKRHKVKHSAASAEL